jgi:hypothetical protein
MGFICGDSSAVEKIIEAKLLNLFYTKVEKGAKVRTMKPVVWGRARPPGAPYLLPKQMNLVLAAGADYFQF